MIFLWREKASGKTSPCVRRPYVFSADLLTLVSERAVRRFCPAKPTAMVLKALVCLLVCVKMKPFIEMATTDH